MADGSITIEIKGNASDLTNELNKVSQTASKQLGNAFSGANSAISETANKVGDIGDKAEKSADKVGKIGDEAEDAADSVGDIGDEAKKTADGLDDAAEASEEVGEGLGNSEKKGRSFSDVIKSIGDKFKDISEKAQSFSDVFKGSFLGNLAADFVEKLGSAVLDLGKKIIEVGSQFETSFSKVQTIMDPSQMGITEMKTAILDLSTSTGVAASDIAETVYNAISATGDTAHAVELVGNATKLAAAGFTDTDSALSVLTTTINAYGLSASEAESISDSLIMTQNLGVTTIDQLASSMGKAISTASAYSINLGNLEAAYISLTKAGISTEESTTYLSSMFNELGDSGSKVGEIIQSKTGKSFGTLMKEGSSLGDVLSILVDYVDGDTEALMNLWGSAEAGKAASAIVSQGLDEFNSNLEKVENSAGTTESAYEKMTNTFQHKMEELKTSLGNFGIKLFEGFSGPATAALSGLTTMFSGAQKILEPIFEGIQMSFQRVKDAINNAFTPEQQAAISNFFQTLGSVMLAVPFAVVGTLIQVVAGAFELLVSVAGVVVTFFSETLPSAFSSFGQIVSEIFTTVVEAGSNFVSTIVDAFAQIGSEIGSALTSAKETVTNIFDSIKQTISDKISSAKQTVTSGFESIKQAISEKVSAAKQTVSDVFESIKQTISDKASQAKSTVTSAFESIKQTISDKINQAKSTATSAFESIRSTISDKINSAKQTVSSAFESIRSTISDKINSAKSTVTSVFDSIRSSISDKINTARDTVKNAIDKIKSFFNFSWSLPHLKLPHLSISGSFSLNPPSVPHFSISWYKKGGVMMDPTIFGVAGSTLLAGGEAGPEAIAPISVLQDYVSEAVEDGLKGYTDKIRSVVEDEVMDVSEILEGKAKHDGGDIITNNGGTTLNVYVATTGNETPQKARDIGREIGAETAREMRRRGLAMA